MEKYVKSGNHRQVRKTFRVIHPGNSQKWQWVEKPPSPVLQCACGKKYIKTRRGQRTCIPCIYGHYGSTVRKYKNKG